MAEGGDIKAHAQTYAGFTTMIKISSVVTFVLTMLVVILIAS